MAVELNWGLTWIEQAEMDWWEANPTATEAEFEAAFYL
jgi:hypothetical protein